jgi:mannose-1-phosphate guanylyltransferase
MHRMNMWAVVLAGGDGTRLQGLTRNVHGVVVPKQFCSLQGGASLLQEALQRAAMVASTPQVCAVVAAQHREWWSSVHPYLPRGNLIVQPHNRGTAHGVLLPLLHIIERDPDATVVLLPSDHHLCREEILIDALRGAAEHARRDPDSIYLLGLKPDEPDEELGYILPAEQDGEKPVSVLRFVEKPTDTLARSLISRGALWNSFILAASAKVLLRSFDASFAAAVDVMCKLDHAELDIAYQHLRCVDFSRDVLQGKEAMLKVVPVASCGWTDLGTPKRVGLALRRLAEADFRPRSFPHFPTHLSLADQYSRFGPSDAVINSHSPQ